jgi:hypothetical protein
MEFAADAMITRKQKLTHLSLRMPARLPTAKITPTAWMIANNRKSSGFRPNGILLSAIANDRGDMAAAIPRLIHEASAILGLRGFIFRRTVYSALLDCLTGRQRMARFQRRN